MTTEKVIRIDRLAVFAAIRPARTVLAVEIWFRNDDDDTKAVLNFWPKLFLENGLFDGLQTIFGRQTRNWMDVPPEAPPRVEAGFNGPDLTLPYGRWRTPVVCCLGGNNEGHMQVPCHEEMSLYAQFMSKPEGQWQKSEYPAGLIVGMSSKTVDGDRHVWKYQGPTDCNVATLRDDGSFSPGKPIVI